VNAVPEEQRSTNQVFTLNLHKWVVQSATHAAKPNMRRASLASGVGAFWADFCCPQTVPTLYPKPRKHALFVPIRASRVLLKPLVAQQKALWLWHYESAALTAELQARVYRHILH